MTKTSFCHDASQGESGWLIRSGVKRQKMNGLKRAVFVLVVLLVNSFVFAQDFRSFQEKFPLVASLQIDSLFIDTFPFEPTLEGKLSQKDRSFVPDELMEMCFRNTAKYHLQPYAKLNIPGELIHLIFYAELNSSCEFEGYERRFWLVSYYQDGKILRSKLIGGELSLFGYVLRTYSSWKGGDEIEISELEFEDEPNKYTSTRQVLQLD